MKKKVLSIILCAAMLASLSPAFAAAAEDTLAVTVRGTRDGDTAHFTVNFENSGDDRTLFVYTALFNADGTLRRAVRDAVEVKASSSLACGYDASLDGGSASLYVWDEKNKPLCEPLSSEDCENVPRGESVRLEITGQDVWVSDEPESANGAANAVDGDLESCWTVQTSSEAPQSLTAYLGGTYIVTKVGAALNLATEREYDFSISLSCDGENFTDVVQRKIADKTDDVVYFDTPPVAARYMRVTLYGRRDKTGLQWTRLSEIEAYGCPRPAETIFEEDFSSLENWSLSPMDEMTYTDYTPSLGSELYAESAEMPESGSGAVRLFDNADRSGKTEGEALKIKGISASQTPEEKNAPANAIDGDEETIWTASGVTDAAPAALTISFDKAYSLTKVGIAFGSASEARSYVVTVSLSEDGKSYADAAVKREITQAKNSAAVQYIDFAQTRAQYVRFTFYARTDLSNNGWIRVAEVSAVGTEGGIEGAGGMLFQRGFTPPPSREDYRIEFDMYLPSRIGSAAASNYYSGISLTDGIISGGADLTRCSALQLRFENSSGGVKIKTLTSNYFNEGTPRELFESVFLRDALWHVALEVSPSERRAYITVSDGVSEETRMVYFAYGDAELTRNSAWANLEANTLVFNTGAGAKSEMYISDVKVGSLETAFGTDPSVGAVNGIVRLEEVRLEDDPTTNRFYGMFVYHSGEGQMLAVEEGIDPKMTRFVEREGLAGSGVSFEAVTLPGYFAVCHDGGIYLEKLENNGVFYANATFMKTEEENIGYYTGGTYSYKTYLNRDKYFYDSRSNRYDTKGQLKPWSVYVKANSVFYLRSEAVSHVCDNFYGSSIGSQWWTNYPWKSNNPTNDSFNFSALIDYRNVIVENGELFLKATKVSGWPTNTGGATGIDYNESYGKTWERWKGRVGVVSVKNKVFNRQCYIEGSFKQPDSPIGYWNAFWLRGRDKWPPEIDIFEFLSSNYGHKAWHTAIHGEDDKNNLFGKRSKDGTDLTDGYHTFALDWGYDYVKFYIDGKQFEHGQNSATINYQKNVQIVLNTGIGGWEAEPDETMVWDDGLRCRYIRSFQYG